MRKRPSKVRDALPGRRLSARLRKLQKFLRPHRSASPIPATEGDFGTAFDYSSIGMALVSLDGRWLRVNRTLSAMLGYPPEELLRTDFQTLTHPDDLPRDLEHVRRLLSGEISSYVMEKRYFHRDGGIVTAALSVALVRDDAGQPLYFISQLEDVTRRQQAEQALRRSEQRLSLAMAAAGQGMFDVDLSRGQVSFSAETARLLGYPPEPFTMPAAQVRDWLHPGDVEATVAAARDYLAGARAEYRAVFRFRRADGEWRWLLCLGAVVERDASGRPLHLAGTYTDITERKQYEERIEYLANHDALTGLVNRNRFDDRLSQAMARADRAGRGVTAVLMIDLDRFKLVNDSLGHPLGDQLIQAVAARLSRNLRSGDTVARLGGDEFVVLVEALQGAEEVQAIARKLQAALAEAFSIAGHELFTTATIGAALYPADGDTIARLLANAEAAMYRAKLEGGGGFGFYTAELGQRTLERFTMERALRQALERDEFELYYQPQVRLSDRRIVGMEALLRWNQPQMGFVLPGRFIPLAEDTGLIVPIGEWVLQAAAAQQQRWRARGLPQVRIAANVSARQFWQGAVVGTVRQLLARGLLSRGSLEIEVTESAVMRDVAQTARLLEALRELGVVITVDDFGTGYSSLAYLRQLPLQKLKIDQSFVHEIGVAPGADRLVRQIIDLAHAMGMTVVSEGIESAEQLRLLQAWGCDEGQGHYFARALRAESCEALLSAGTLEPAVAGIPAPPQPAG